MSSLTIVVWAAIVPLTQKAPAAKDVKAGWVAFGVFLALAVAVVLLWLSFRKQLKKIDFEEPSGGRTSGQGRGPAAGRNGAEPEEPGPGTGSAHAH